MSFVPIKDYIDSIVDTLEVGRYEGFSVYLSPEPGYKKQLLRYRLHHMQVRVAQRRRQTYARR